MSATLILRLEMRALFQRIPSRISGWIAGMALFAISSEAASQELSVDVARDGEVVVSLLIDAPASNIRHILNDIEGELAALSTDILTVEVLKTGTCQEIARSTRGLLKPFRLRSLRCPTAHGWHESLLASGDFSAYSTDWSLIETAAGTEVVYRVRTELYIFPKPLVTRSVIQSAKEQVVKLARKVARK
jgi:hypothetical protein